MAISNDTFRYAGGAVSDLFSGFGKIQASKATLASAEGSKIEAANYRKAAGYSRVLGQFQEQSNDITDYQNRREAFLSTGKTAADIGGAGLAQSGSAIDILRASASQSALMRATAQAQGVMDVAGYEEQAQSYEGMASAADAAANAAQQQAHAEKKSSTGSFIGAAIGAAAAILPFLSDRRLKKDITRVGAMPSGLPLYRFRYTFGDAQYFVGVMAQEARELFPAAVFARADGYLMVDYARIG